MKLGLIPMESGKNPSVIKTLPMRLHAEGASRRTNTITVHIAFLCLSQWEIIHAANSCPPIKRVLSNKLGLYILDIGSTLFIGGQLFAA